MRLCLSTTLILLVLSSAVPAEARLFGRVITHLQALSERHRRTQTRQAIERRLREQGRRSALAVTHGMNAAGVDFRPSTTLSLRAERDLRSRPHNFLKEEHRASRSYKKHARAKREARSNRHAINYSRASEFLRHRVGFRYEQHGRVLPRVDLTRDRLPQAPTIGAEFTSVSSYVPRPGRVTRQGRPTRENYQRQPQSDPPTPMRVESPPQSQATISKPMAGYAQVIAQSVGSSTAQALDLLESELSTRSRGNGA